jgi:short subunit dehydrogenase-like uncharacterized protein
MQYRTFSLDDRDDVRRGLRGVDVLINAAGPFAWTADRLIKGALDEGCHYVDINGEVDVYKKLDDFGRYAAERGGPSSASAGHTAAASDLLLDAALDHLNYGADLDCGAELGAVRIAMSRVMNLSHGSAETLWRSLREQVTVVRTLEVEDEQGNVTREPTLWHEPVGKLERTFDFRDHGPGNKTVATDLRIASAANLVDTLTARLTVARRKFSAKRIESYVEAGTVARIGYQLGTLLAPVAAIPWYASSRDSRSDCCRRAPRSKSSGTTSRSSCWRSRIPFAPRSSTGVGDPQRLPVHRASRRRDRKRNG